MTKKGDLRQLVALFTALYPDPQSELNFVNDYQLLVAVMLSAQCTDKKVNQVTPQLFGRFPNFGALAAASLHDIEKIIRPINYYRTKAKNLRAMGQAIMSSTGKLPVDRAGLEALPGVGRKTASVVLSEKKIEPALPVDTHVFRVSQRLGLAKSDNREVVEEQLKSKFPPDLWRNLHHWLILHGRRICKAQRPLCAECRLRTLCPSGKLYLGNPTLEQITGRDR